MNNCKYCMSVPNKGILCGYYIENVKDNKNRPYAHYPECNKSKCLLCEKSR